MLENSLPIYCNGICSDYGVLFEMKGNSAYTDYSKVVIPEIDISNNRAVTLGTGYVVHECGHIASTNPDSKKVFFDDNGKVIEPLALSFYRAIEDVRMEREQWTRLQGAKRILNNLVTVLCEQQIFSAISDEDDSCVVLQKFVLYFSRGLVAQQTSVFNMLENNSDVVDDNIPSGVLVRLKALLSTISNLKNTDGSVDLAIKIRDAIDDELEDKSPNTNSSNQPGQQGSSGQSGPSDASASEIKGESEKISKLKASLSSMTESDVIDSDIGDLTAKALNDSSKGAVDKIVPVAKLHSYPGTNDSSITKEANALSNVLRTRLLNYLEEQSDISYRHTDDGDEIDDLRLSEVMLGETEVYLERTKTDFTYDTSVHILLDRSGSMSSRIHKACVATLGIALTLNQVDGVSCSATAFPSGQNDVLLLSDGNDVRQQTQRFNLSVSGSTPMASAMWQSLQMLYASEHKRLVLIVVTDGAPDHDQSAATRRLIRDCISSQIDVVGVGIGGNTNVAKLFPHAVEVQTVEQLAPALFLQLQNLLTLRAA